MTYQRVLGAVAIVTAMLGGAVLAAPATPARAGSVTTPSFPLDTTDPVIHLLRDVDGTVTGVVATNTPISLPKGTVSSPVGAAVAHVRRFAGRLGVDPASLRPVADTHVAGGDSVKLQQYIGGVPVVGGELVASLDDRGGLEAMLGETAKGAVENPTDLLGDLVNAAKARTIARDYIGRLTGRSSLGFRVESKGTWIYNPSLLGAPGPDVNRETWKLRVFGSDGLVDYTVFVDRARGAVSLAVDNNHEAVRRDVCDLANADVGTSDAAVCDGTTVPFARREGQPASPVSDVNTIYANLGLTARWYSSYAGVDVSSLIGGTDRTLRATTRVCATAADDQKGCPMGNAFWSESLGQMVYGDGVTALDVTAHELTHGVTAHTSKLYYAYQSGAINESMSDVFGELIDQAAHPSKIGSDQAWLIGEDNHPAAPDVPVPLRSMKDPTLSQSPDRVTSQLWDPDPEFRDDGGVHTNAGPGDKAAYLIAAGDTFNGYTVRGLGLAKTFKIYWTAENLLTSGADYRDLFYALPLACRKNVGRPGTLLTEDDCRQVDNAVRATEMDKAPVNAAPAAAQTPTCPSDEPLQALTKEIFEGAYTCD